jgi:hypothetical protein
MPSITIVTNTRCSDDIDSVPIDAIPKLTIDRDGKVYNTRTRKYMQGALDRGGRRVIGSEDVERKNTFILHLSKIVLSTFHRCRADNETVFYIDSDMDNNKLSNLRWVTPTELEEIKCLMPIEHEHEWRTIPGFPRYAMDRYGRAFNKRNKKEMKRLRGNGEYKVLALSTKDGGMNKQSVQRCMLMAWVGPPSTPEHTADHFPDRDPNNNELENLRWATKRMQNENRGPCKARGVRKVRRTDAQGVETVYDCPQLAADNSGVTRDTIITNIANCSTSSKGYKFMYEPFEIIESEKWVLVPGSTHGTKISSEGRYLTSYGIVSRGTASGQYLATRIVGLAGSRAVIHRLVAKAFVHNPCPEKFDIVHHKNAQKHDNRAVNLEWTDGSGNMQASAEMTAKTIYQYSVESGRYIQSFGSPIKASNTTKIVIDGIWRCASGERYSSGNFIWSYLKVDAIIPRIMTQQEVYQFDKNSKFLNEYPSAKEAAKATGGNANCIDACARGVIASSGGFSWIF